MRPNGVGEKQRQMATCDLEGTRGFTPSQRCKTRALNTHDSFGVVDIIWFIIQISRFRLASIPRINLVSSLFWIWPSSIKCYSFWPPNEWVGPFMVDKQPRGAKWWRGQIFAGGSPGHRMATLCCIENFKGSFSQNSHLVPFISQILPWLLLDLQSGLQKPIYQHRCACLLERLLLSNGFLSDTIHPHSWTSDGHSTCCSWALPSTELYQRWTQVRSAGGLTKPSPVGIRARQGWLARLEPGLRAGGRVSGEAG